MLSALHMSPRRSSFETATTAAVEEKKRGGDKLLGIDARTRLLLAVVYQARVGL